MSTHKVEVVRLGPIEKHPNADKLGLVQIWGFTVITALEGGHKEGDLVAYIEPDYVVPLDRPEFSFLTDSRIRAKRLRGIWSQGLLVPAPEGAVEGDNVMEQLGIIRYEPKIKYTRYGGIKGESLDAEKAHESLRWLPKYDLENLRRYKDVFEAGEKVYVSEKIHGANARFAWRDGRMWLGSRSQWKKPEDNSWWRMALESNPWIELWCTANPTSVLYGEIYGMQDLQYKVPDGQMHFKAFDVMHGNQFMNAREFCMAVLPEHRAPGEFMEFDFEKLVERSLEFSRVCPGQIGEGIVVKPVEERVHRNVGRVALKLVSDKYLERAK